MRPRGQTSQRTKLPIPGARHFPPCLLRQERRARQVLDPGHGVDAMHKILQQAGAQANSLGAGLG